MARIAKGWGIPSNNRSEYYYFTRVHDLPLLIVTNVTFTASYLGLPFGANSNSIKTDKPPVIQTVP